MKGKKNILLIASAGGHLTQGLLLLNEIDEFIVVSDKKLTDDNRVAEFYKIINTQKNVLVHMINFFISIYIVLKTKPDVVVATGGAICLPILLIAKAVRIPVIYIDTMSRVLDLSNTGKFVYKYKLYRDFICQWEDLANKYCVEYYGQIFNIGNVGD